MNMLVLCLHSDYQVASLSFRNMLDRYVNDEFKAADKDFSSGMLLLHDSYDIG